MIGRVYRGSKVGGLVRYLYGPGRHNEHVDQRLVACWSGADVQALAAVEPEVLASGERDYRGLIAELEAPMAYAGRMDPNPIWHCPLRTARRPGADRRRVGRRRGRPDAPHRHRAAWR